MKNTFFFSSENPYHIKNTASKICKTQLDTTPKKTDLVKVVESMRISSTNIQLMSLFFVVVSRVNNKKFRVLDRADKIAFDSIKYFGELKEISFGPECRLRQSAEFELVRSHKTIVLEHNTIGDVLAETQIVCGVAHDR